MRSHPIKRDWPRLIAPEFLEMPRAELTGARNWVPHHLRLTQHCALGRKASDEFAVPLCRGHHREVHRSGDEAAWWKCAGVDPTFTARALWLETHPLPTIAATGDIDRPFSEAGTDQSNSKGDRPIRKAGSNRKTNPIIPVGPQ